MTKREEFDAAKKRSEYEANRLLFAWLSNDDDRAGLYRCLRDEPRVLEFQSRADTKERVTDDGYSEFHQEVCLLTARSHIETAMREKDHFSCAPYRALGSGTFMLGLDDADPDHNAQREFAKTYLKVDASIVSTLSRTAFLAAAVLPLKQRNFDLVDLSEQAALRFAGFLFGFAQADHVLLEGAMRKAYRGLTYQMLGRHFVTEPGAVQDATIAMGALLQRVAYLIDLYRARVGREQDDEYKRIDDELEELREFEDRKGNKPLKEFVPVLRRIAEQEDQAVKYSGTDLAVIVVGLIAGTIGNVQAAVSISIYEFFGNSDRGKRAREEAYKSWLGDDVADRRLQAWIWEALRLNPPAAFLPRKTVGEFTFGDGTSIPADRVVILAIGGATRDKDEWSEPDQFKADRNDHDPLVFGGPQGESGFIHQCIGQHLAMPLITHIVRQVLLLPGLAQSLDPETGEPRRLEKLWGFMCQKYPLEYKRGELLTQSPLLVVMNVKTPVSEHAEALKKVIRYGAPRIEKKLRDAKHVHFAQFLFIENDTKLVLFTIYDRDFDSYIEYFALQIGPLFDRIFEHIQGAPPMPVNKFPKEFVDTIRRHNAHPVADYFFSAYPRADVSMIDHEFNTENP